MIFKKILCRLLKRVKTAKKVKFINSEIIKLMNERDYCKKLYDKSVKSGQSTDDLWLIYKQLRNNTLKSIRKMNSRSQTY